VEEIVAVMRAAGGGADGARGPWTSALIEDGRGGQ
jgi:hypothetical protein